MATTKELLNIENTFLFRGKTYKFCRHFPMPSITMITEDGEMLSFGEDTPISDEFILIDS